jgi:hypothetical protein
LGDRRPVTGQPDQGHREALLNAMRNGSVGAYGHFNLHGEFGFSPERMIDSIGFAKGFTALAFMNYLCFFYDFPIPLGAASMLRI